MNLNDKPWAEGLNPSYQAPLGSKSKLALSAIMVDQDTPVLAEGINEEFLIKVLNKRIEVLKLPITFSYSAKVMVLALTDRPGSVMVLLIDCLNAYEGETVTAQMIARLYPEGFYDEATLIRYVDDYIKSKKMEWAEIY